jgi:tetratricopeptide (TPR) repeat protein
MRNTIFRLLLISMLLLPFKAFAQSVNMTKVASRIFTLTTFNADGSIHGSTHGVFTGTQGEAIAPWHVFEGAVRATVIDNKGQQSDVDAIIGASEMYDLCRFRVKGTRLPAGLTMNAQDNPANPIFLVSFSTKKVDSHKVVPVRTEKFMNTYNYYVFNDVDVSSTDLGCPIVNGAGQLLGVMQRPQDGGQAFSADARLTTSFSTNGLSLADPTLKTTGIRPALPTDEQQATLMLVLAAEQTDSTNYETYIHEYISRFPTATTGYITLANWYERYNKFSLADATLKTETQKAAKKDEAYYDYAKTVYHAAIARVDTLYPSWTFQRATELAQQAEKISPLPIYKHLQAQILYATGNYDQALEAFTALQRTDLGKNGEVYFEAAQCKTQLKAPTTEIISLLDKAVSVQSGSPSAPYVLARARVYDLTGDYRKAFNDYLAYDSLVNFQGTDDFYYSKFKCEMKLRQYQLALNDIAHAIILNRTAPTYYAEMASLQLKVGKYEDAVKTCDLALQLTQQYSDLYIIKGIALCELKKNEEGINALTSAQQLGDSRAEGLIKKYKK